MAAPPADGAVAGESAQGRRFAQVVLLAAGRSSRLGLPKGLVVVQGRPWILHQLDALEGRRAVVVLGDDREQYLSTVPTLVAGAAGSVAIAVNPAPERGPFSSLQVGLGEVTRGSAAFVLPIDVPAASARTWSDLEEALAATPEAEAVVPTYGQDGQQRGGHPILLSTGLVRALGRRPAQARLDHELAELMRRVPDPHAGQLRPAADPGYLVRCVRVGALLRLAVDDPRVRLNLNTPADWGKLMEGN